MISTPPFSKYHKSLSFLNSDNFKKSFLKACTCARGKDINAQLQNENSFFPRFGRSRGSDRLASTSKMPANFNKSNITCGGFESAAVMDTSTKNSFATPAICTTIKLPHQNNQNGNHNGCNVQRPPVLHTDL